MVSPAVPPSGRVIAIGIVLTQSRGALVGFGVVGILMVAKRYVRFRHAAAIAAVTVVIVLMSPTYRDRLVRLANIGGLFSQDVRTSAISEDGNILGRANEAVTAMLVVRGLKVVPKMN